MSQGIVNGRVAVILLWSTVLMIVTPFAWPENAPVDPLADEPANLPFRTPAQDANQFGIIEAVPMPSVYESVPANSMPENGASPGDSPPAAHPDVIVVQTGGEQQGERREPRLEASADWQYSTNGPVQQGYSLPRLYVGVRGEFTPGIEYRFATGEARESSSMQLPFLIPKEASLRIKDLGDGATSLKVGLFRPWLNRYWSNGPGIFPDYLATHSNILLSEQLGLEGCYTGSIDVGLGMANGNGIVALNTNNSRAFYLFLRNTSDPASVEWGMGAYSFQQSAVGSANFRNNWVANGYVSFQIPSMGVRLGGEASWGAFSDTDSDYFIHAWAAFVFLPFLGSDLMVRAEVLDNTPSFGGRTLKQVQLGPVFRPVPSLSVFLTEQYTEPGVTAGELTTFLRLRADL